jgi:hypothetical protein
MKSPLHLSQTNRSPKACRLRADHAMAMMALQPKGNGFRQIPEHSDQHSLVERYLIEAGDMKPMPRVPPDRRYRQVRRPRF